MCTLDCTKNTILNEKSKTIILGKRHPTHGERHRPHSPLPTPTLLGASTPGTFQKSYGPVVNVQQNAFCSTLYDGYLTN